MVRDRWLKLPLAARLMLVVGAIILLFAFLVRLLPEPWYPLLALLALVAGVGYAAWEWSDLRRQRSALEAQLRRQQQDWQRGLPAHLRTPEESPAAEENSPNPSS